MDKRISQDVHIVQRHTEVMHKDMRTPRRSSTSGTLSLRNTVEPCGHLALPQRVQHTKCNLNNRDWKFDFTRHVYERHLWRGISHRHGVLASFSPKTGTSD